MYLPLAAAKLASALTSLADSTEQYICKDSLYAEIVTFLAKDLFGNSAKKVSVVITVVNRPPLGG